MKFKANKTLLANALTRLRPATGGKTVLPILAGIIIDVRDGKAILTATNLDIMITSTVEVEADECGTTVVEFAKLSAFVNAMPSGTILFRSKKFNDTLRIEMTCESFRSTLATMAADDFPKIAEIKQSSASVKLDTAHLIRPFLFTQHAYALPNDTLHQGLQGAIVEIGNGSLVCVGTDGRRLSVCGPVEKRDNVTEVIVPTKLVNAIVNAARGTTCKWAVVCDGSMIRVSSEDDAEISVQGKLKSNCPPSWRQVIPPDGDALVRIKADRAKIVESISRAAMSAENRGDVRSICISASCGKLTLDGHDEQSTAHVEMEVEQSGGDIDVMYMNPDFLIAAFQSFSDDEIEIAFENERSPIKITGDGCLEVVMPLRID